MENFAYIMQRLLEGFGQTVLLFTITIIFSLTLGVLLALGALSSFKPLKYLVKCLVWVIRGTPLILQIMFIQALPNTIFKVGLAQISSALNCKVRDVQFIFVAIAFIINYACYFSEIFRAGIESIPKGQTEAGKVLGLTQRQIFTKIILMQVVKRTVPPVGNEIITLVKDTALASVAGVIDLYNAAASAVNKLVILTPFVYAAVFYLIFNGVLTLILSKIEKKLNYYKV